MVFELFNSGWCFILRNCLRKIPQKTSTFSSLTPTALAILPINILHECAQEHKYSWAVRLAQCSVFYGPWYLWGIIYILIDHFPTKSELTSPKKEEHSITPVGSFLGVESPSNPILWCTNPKFLTAHKNGLNFHWNTTCLKNKCCVHELFFIKGHKSSYAQCVKRFKWNPTVQFWGL